MRPPGTGPSGFSAPNGYRRLSPKDPPPFCPGCRPRHGAQGFQLSFFLSKRKLAKEKCALRKSVSPVATGDQRLCLWKPPPFGKGGPKLYWPSALLAKTPGTDYKKTAGDFSSLAVFSFILCFSITFAVLLFASFSSFARRKRSGAGGKAPVQPMPGCSAPGLGRPLRWRRRAPRRWPGRREGCRGHRKAPPGWPGTGREWRPSPAGSGCRSPPP